MSALLYCFVLLLCFVVGGGCGGVFVLFCLLFPLFTFLLCLVLVIKVLFYCKLFCMCYLDVVKCCLDGVMMFI